MHEVTHFCLPHLMPVLRHTTSFLHEVILHCLCCRACIFGVTTCLESLEMSGNFEDVREKSWNMGKVGGMSGKIVLGKIIVAFLRP